MANARTHSRCPAVIWFPAALLALGVGVLAFGQAPPELIPPGQVSSEPVPPGQLSVPDARATGEEQVVEVKVVGLKRVPWSKISPQIHTRAGRAFDQQTVEEDMRRLNRTGLFYSAKPSTVQVAGGRVVIFEVLEKRIIGYVKYVGNTVRKKKLAEEAVIKQGDAMDLYAIEEARRRIEEYYRTKGYPKARVTVVEGTKETDQGVVFLINEGVRQRVAWTNFIGNTIAWDDRLRTQVKSKPGILWFLGGDVDFKQIEDDKNVLTDYYRALGFFSAKIGREWESTADGKWLFLTYVIDEGPRYALRNISVIGNTKFATEDLMAKLKLQSGEYFNRSKMQSDQYALQDTYGAVGYVFADVQPEQLLLEEPGQLDLVYRIKEGNRYRVGRIDVKIKGEYPHTRMATVLNRMSLKPGDIVDTRELRASERRLRASGLFKVAPDQGVVPKIVFSPPTAEDLEKNEKGVAEKPERDGFRGQSPDGPTDCYGVIKVEVEFLDTPPSSEPAAAEPAPPVQEVAPPPTVRGQGPSLWPMLPGWVSRKAATPAPQPPSGTAAPQFTWREGQGNLSAVTRGQYTAGTSFPQQYNPNAGRVSSTPSRTSTTYPSTSATTTTTTTTTPATTTWSPVTTTAGQPAAAASSSTTTAQTAAPAPVYGNQLGLPPVTDPAFVRPGAVDPLQPPITQDPTGLLGLPPDDQILDLPLRPELMETETGKLMFSVGVNSDAGLIGSVIIDEQNFDWRRWPRSWEDIRNATAWRGDGQRLRIEAVPGTSTQRYSVTFQEPYLWDTRVSLGLSAYYFERNYEQWDEERMGGRVALGYQFTPDLSGTLAFRGANINVSDAINETLPDLAEVLGDNALYGFEARLAHDTRDSTFMPTEGHLLEFAVEQVIGSFEYPRAEVEMRQYFMVHERPDGSGRHVLSLGGKMAVSGDDTPIYDRYFAGGFTTIRGFDFREASPMRDGVWVGGEFMLLASAEYMFPITASDALRGVVFCDTGVVQPTINDWTDKYRVSPGVGLRISIPAMGPQPIALDLAFPVVKEDTDDVQTFSFFMGFTR